MKTYIKLLLSVFVAFAATSSFAKVWMPKIFSDNMLIQRDTAVRFWGTATPGASIMIDCDGVKTSEQVRSKNGTWELYLPLQAASKNPKTIKVFENGKKQLEFKNVLIGEVWIAAGQSNMELTMNAIGKNDELKTAGNLPNFRYFKQRSSAVSEKPEKDTPKGAEWQICTPDSAKSFSAVAFYFAEKLGKDLDVPVGIIFAANGATQVACWIPEKNASKDEVTKSVADRFKKEKAEYTPEAYKKKLAEHKAIIEGHSKLVEKAKAEGKPAPKLSWTLKVEPLSITPWLSNSTPFYHYNAKIAPIAGYTARGVIWYQGESNALDKLYPNYEKQFANMVESWREAWKLSLAFFQVQLASFDAGKRNKWAEVRWGQYLATKELTAVNMICAIDTGEEKNIHPFDKSIVGERLANSALREIYLNRDVHALYPEPTNFKYRGDTVTIRINGYNKKLETKGEQRGFEVLVAGEWKPASAQLRGFVLKVKSLDAAPVEGVRYLHKAWAKPDVWIFDEGGHPLIPFINENKK